MQPTPTKKYKCDCGREVNRVMNNLKHVICYECKRDKNRSRSLVNARAKSSLKNK